MEDLLHLYSLDYDEKRPLVCFDELPVQLLGDVVAPLEMKKGKPRREDYEYERGGVGVLLVAFEPLTGWRLVETSRRRTKADYCRFMRRVAEMFPAADRIVLVQDNLNTRDAGSFYENLPPDKPSRWRKRSRCITRPRKAHG